MATPSATPTLDWDDFKRMGSAPVQRSQPARPWNASLPSRLPRMSRLYADHTSFDRQPQRLYPEATTTQTWADVNDESGVKELMAAFVETHARYEDVPGDDVAHKTVASVVRSAAEAIEQLAISARRAVECSNTCLERGMDSDLSGMANAAKDLVCAQDVHLAIRHIVTKCEILRERAEHGLNTISDIDDSLNARLEQVEKDLDSVMNSVMVTMQHDLFYTRAVRYLCESANTLDRIGCKKHFRERNIYLTRILVQMLRPFADPILDKEYACIRTSSALLTAGLAQPVRDWSMVKPIVLELGRAACRVCVHWEIGVSILSGYQWRALERSGHDTLGHKVTKRGYDTPKHSCEGNFGRPRVLFTL